MIGIPPVGGVNCRWLHFDDIAGEKVTIGHPEYLFMNETPYTPHILSVDAQIFDLLSA
jgi:hypothetical protein